MSARLLRSGANRAAIFESPLVKSDEPDVGFLGCQTAYDGDDEGSLHFQAREVYTQSSTGNSGGFRDAWASENNGVSCRSASGVLGLTL